MYQHVGLRMSSWLSLKVKGTTLAKAHLTTLSVMKNLNPNWLQKSYLFDNFYIFIIHDVYLRTVLGRVQPRLIVCVCLCVSPAPLKRLYLKN